MSKETEWVSPQSLSIKCHLCGKTEELEEYDPASPLYDIMHDRHLCYSCAFWTDKIEHPLADREIIGGHHYTVHPLAKRPENIIRGFFGREFFIRRFNGTLANSNNVWHQGKIPEMFREYLPDTAVFISLMAYQRLKNDCHKCAAKGCWDRYHCFRYDLSCEKNGAFNQVPTNHRIGSERCPSFINRSELGL